MKRDPLKSKAKKRHWLSLRHYRMDILDKVAKGTSGYVKSLIYKKLLQEKGTD